MHALSRESGFAPTKDEFRVASGVSYRSYLKFFGHYTELVARCGYKTQTEKKRVARVQLRKAMSLAAEPAANSGRDEAVFGDRIEGYDLLHAPVNEQGVVMLFGMMAKKLEFLIEVVRTGYPDCEAKRKCADGKWRRVRIEFEYQSGGFNHDPKGCDLVVCWENNVKNIGVEVLELKRYFDKDAPAQTSGAVHEAA